MDDNIVIKVENVSKKYCKSLKRSMLYGVKDIGRNILGMSSHSDTLRKNEFWALNDVSFEVKKGETLGIIGPNGSGKTTLLKLLNGIFWPDKGKITIKSKVGALIEVGAGFHPLLTGRENVYINAAILGMIKEEVGEKFDSIVDFADIGDFLDTPVKYYSSGMLVRLGFSIAAHCEPDVLLVDEVLAVGDYAFQARCYNRINQFKTRGVSTVFISHNLDRVRQYCDRTLFLNQGHMVRLGPTEDVCEHYVRSIQEKMSKEKPNQSIGVIRDWGIFGPILLDSPIVQNVHFELVDEAGNQIEWLRTGDRVAFRFSFDLTAEVNNLEITVPFYREDGLPMTTVGSRRDGVKLRKAKGRIAGAIRIPKFIFYPGHYVAVFIITDGAEYLYRDPRFSFEVYYEKKFGGLFDIQHIWDMKVK